jgi:Tfp pilus assembly protein PilV
MKKLTIAVLICMAITRSLAQGTDNEKVVRAYYSGFEKHDWKEVAAQFAGNFTFTSPNNDDHIPVKKFKEKCWPTNKFFKKVNFIKMAESGNNLFLLVEITTTDHKIVRNVDFFSFDAGKIKSIESYFGPGEWFPGNKK